MAQSQQATNTGAAGPQQPRRRIALRAHPDTLELARYWAKRAGVSVNEWIVEALEERIDRVNGNYDLPTLEIARLNQLVDNQRAMTANIANLERVVVSMSESILGLARGDNYLMDDEDGELAAGE